ncbi:MAG: DUF4175 family protein [Bacteroidota bacterium]
MTNPDNYQVLLNKLDEFIRKYYKNQLIRGGLYTITAILAFYLSVALLESFAWFSSTVRSVLFYSLIGSSLFILYKWVFIPLSHLYHIGKIISHAEAARIIGEHFSDISDKLLNTLQLKHQASYPADQMELVYASINQKSDELRPVPFTAAIDFSRNSKYVRYALIPVLILAVILIADRSLLSESTARLIQHGTDFIKPAPFQFLVTNKSLQVVQNDDFPLTVKLAGDEIPSEIYISYNGAQFRLDKEDKMNFAYQFKNVQKKTTFTLTADGFSSQEYTLDALANPVVTNFEMSLTYPSYLGKQNEMVKNTGDLMVPAGTLVRWIFNTENTSQLELLFQDTTYKLSGNQSQYTLTRKLLKNNLYSVRTSNDQLKSRDSLRYTINVIPDNYPAIDVEQQQDSASYKKYYFRGLVKDDYGLSRLQFRYKFLKRDSAGPDAKDHFEEEIALNRNVQQEQFFYFWDLGTLGLQPGDEIEYYFEVWDNDGVNGAKSARSQSNIYKAPSLQELAENANKKNNELKDDLNDGLKKAKKLQRDLSDANKQLMNKKNLDYEDRKKVSDILEQQKELEKKIAEIQKQSEENTQKQNEFRKPDEQLAEKQKQLQDLFEKLVSPEMKKMMEELQKLMAELNKQELQEAMDKLKLDNKDMEKEIDRALELFKKLELEQQMKETADQLEKLAEDEDKLSEKAEEKKSDADEMQKDQKELSKSFDELQKQLDDIAKKNKELEYSQDMPDMKPEREETDKEMQNSEEQLSQGNKSKAGKSQKKAADKLHQMAAMMRNQMNKNEDEQQEEDMQAMRALLENLLHFSFEQEGLMEEARTMDINNPRYLKIAQQQRKLKDDARMLEDSLLALSKRVMQIQSAVNEHLTDINANIDKSINNLQDRQVAQARSNQQFVMTAANDLALMLSESLDQMQQDMQEKKPGSGKCNKPGGKGKGKPGPSASDVKKMQEKLSQQLKEMKEKGQKPGPGQPNKKPGEKPGEGGISQELAKMAAQQEAIRNALKGLNTDENKDGKGKLGDLGKIMEQMEENEKDIVNKRITDATLRRQQDIMTRLLESEKAEKEREQEETRESHEARPETGRNPGQFEEYKRLKLREMELLKTIPPSLTTFYKNLVNSYFQSLEN